MIIQNKKVDRKKMNDIKREKEGKKNQKKL